MRAKVLEKVAFLAALCGVLFVPLWTMIGRSFSPDSYAYALLGSRLWNAGEYASMAIRDFGGLERIPQPSRSFPPLWPMFVGLGQTVSGAGILSGAFVGVLTLVLTIVLVWRMCEALRSSMREPLWLLLGFACFAFADRAYSVEIAAGRSMGLVVLIYVGLLFLIVRSVLEESERTRERVTFSLGLCAGLLLLARFDQTVFVAGLLIGIALLRGRRAGLVMALGLFVALVPWIVRNLLVFHAPWASDNTLTVRSLYPREMGFVYFAPGHDPGTWRTNPTLWIQQRAGYLGQNLLQLSFSTHDLAQMVIPAAVFMWKRSSRGARWLMGVMGWHLVAVIATLSLTPFRWPRYFTTAHLEVWFVLAIVLAQVLPERARLTELRRWAVVACAALFLFVRGVPNQPMVVRSNDVPARVVPLGLAEALPTSRPVFVGSDEAERFTWFTGRPAIYVPYNAESDHDSFQAWLQHFHPTHLALPMWKAQALGLLSRPPLAKTDRWVLVETGLEAPAWVAGAAK